MSKVNENYIGVVIAELIDNDMTTAANCLRDCLTELRSLRARIADLERPAGDEPAVQPVGDFNESQVPHIYFKVANQHLRPQDMRLVIPFAKAMFEAGQAAAIPEGMALVPSARCL